MISRLEGRKPTTPRLNCKVMGSMNGNGSEIEKTFIESWDELSDFPYRRNIKIIANNNPIFLQDLSRFVHSLKYKITMIQYEPLIDGSGSPTPNKEVLGVLKGIKNDDRLEKLKSVLLYPGVLLFIVGLGLFLMSVSFAWFYSLLGSFGILLFFGIILKSPQEEPDQLIILFDVLFIERHGEKNPIGLEKQNLGSKNSLTFYSEFNSAECVLEFRKISEIDFKVGGTATRDVDKILNHLHNYKI